MSAIAVAEYFVPLCASCRQAIWIDAVAVGGFLYHAGCHFTNPPRRVIVPVVRCAAGHETHGVPSGPGQWTVPATCPACPTPTPREGHADGA